MLLADEFGSYSENEKYNQQESTTKKKKKRKNNVEREDGAEISNNKKGLSWNENTEDAVIF